VTPGVQRVEQRVEQRLFMRVADRAAFACARNPRAPCYPAWPEMLGWQLGITRVAGPLERAGDAATDHQAPCTAELAAWRSE
jgi:hypothetical protein